jgi:nucleotide-binding universal stress UspA family protein
MAAIRHILVPVDFSETSQRALDAAVDLAKSFGASLTVMHAWQISPFVALETPSLTVDVVTPIEDAAYAQLEAAVAPLAGKLQRVDAVLRNGAAWQQILDVAREKNVDLIVVGTHGRAGVKRALLGSVAEKVVRMSPVPVLTVRPAPEARAQAAPPEPQPSAPR